MNTPTNSVEMIFLEVTNTVEKEWDQLNTRLVKYDQNSK
jgi:hypothetical protein